MSNTLNEVLGLEPDATVDGFTPHLIRAVVTSANSDTTMLSFTYNGEPVVGVLPVTERAPGTTWDIGTEHTVVLCEPAKPTTRPRLSAVRRELIAETLASLSPEVRSGDVRIMGVARRPGVRTKVAVAATVDGLDPIASCVGRGHNRVDALRAALGGEQVDIVAWHPDKATFLSNALQPAAITNIDINLEDKTAVASTPTHQMSAAVGAGGLNSALAGKLVGLMVTITAA